jgi:hypothetical protein
MSDQDTYLQARDAFRRFVAVCHELAQKLRPDDSNLRILVPARLLPRMLAEAAEKTQEFGEFADAIFRLAPPDPTRSISVRVALMQLAYESRAIDVGPEERLAAQQAAIEKALGQQTRVELQHYLRRFGFYQHVLRGSEVEFGALLDRFRDDPSYEATSLIAIDGLSLHGGDVVINETTRLRTLDREDLNEFFEVKDIRNRIVHGDEPLLDDELVAAVDDLRIWTGKSLTALLRMGGDQGRMVKGQVDRELKAKNRRLVPTYAN